MAQGIWENIYTKGIASKGRLPPEGAGTCLCSHQAATGLLVYINLRTVCLFVCLFVCVTQLFSAPRKPILTILVSN